MVVGGWWWWWWWWCVRGGRGEDDYRRDETTASKRANEPKGDESDEGDKGDEQPTDGAGSRTATDREDRGGEVMRQGSRCAIQDAGRLIVNVNGRRGGGRLKVTDCDDSGDEGDEGEDDEILRITKRREEKNKS
jgi:hypothetical protein